MEREGEEMENKGTDRAYPVVESAKITAKAKEDIVASAKLKSNLERKQLRERRESLAVGNRVNLVSSVKILAIQQSEDMAAIVGAVPPTQILHPAGILGRVVLGRVGVVLGCVGVVFGGGDWDR